MTKKLLSKHDQLLQAVKFNSDGLLPCIAQCSTTNRVLMMAWMNQDALSQTIEKGEAVYWSRSRQQLWHKGEQSGHTQKIVAIQIDCDGDTLLIKVEQHGNIACHTGTNSCFYRELDTDRANVESVSWKDIEQPLKNSEDIYSKS